LLHTGFIYENIVQLLERGAYKEALKLITSAQSLINKHPAHSSTFKIVSDNLEKLTQPNSTEAPVQIVDIPKTTVGSRSSVSIVPAEPISLSAIPTLEEYPGFWGQFSNETLQSFIEFLNNSSTVPIQVNSTLFERLLLRSANLSSLPEDYRAVFFGMAGSTNPIHQQNRQQLVASLHQIIAKRERIAGEKLKKEEAKQAIRTNIPPQQTIQVKPAAKKTRASRVQEPLIEQAEAASSEPAQVDDSQRLALIATQKELILKEKIIRAAIEPLLAFRNFQDYRSSGEYTAITELGGLQIPKLPDGTVSLNEEDYASQGVQLNDAQKVALGYLQSVRLQAAEAGIEWTIPNVQPIKAREELEKIQSWCRAAASDNNFDRNFQLAFWQFLAGRLNGKTFAMQLEDLEHRGIVKNKKINLNQAEFKGLQETYAGLPEICGIDACLSNERFRALSSALEYIIDYELAVHDLKEIVTEVQTAIVENKDMNNIPRPLKVKLTELVSKFARFPIPESIQNKILANFSFSNLLEEVNKLTAFIEKQKQAGIFVAPYIILPIQENESTAEEPQDSKFENVNSMEPFSVEDLKDSHPFTPEQLTKFLRDRKNDFVQRGDIQPNHSPSSIILKSHNHTLPAGEELIAYLKLNLLNDAGEYDQVLRLTEPCIGKSDKPPFSILSCRAIALNCLDRNQEAIELVEQNLKFVEEDNAKISLIQLKALSQLALFTESKDPNYIQEAISSYEQSLNCSIDSEIGIVGLILLAENHSNFKFDQGLCRRVKSKFFELHREKGENYDHIFRETIRRFKELGILPKETRIFNIQNPDPSGEPFTFEYQES
jgi:hypothetical protein